MAKTHAPIGLSETKTEKRERNDEDIVQRASKILWCRVNYRSGSCCNSSFLLSSCLLPRRSDADKGH